MWRAIRHTFLNPYGSDLPGAVAKDGTFKVPDGGLFNFSAYLVKMMAELFESVVEIDVGTWIVSCIVAPGLVPLISADSFTRSLELLGLSIVLTGMWYKLCICIFNIYIQC